MRGTTKVAALSTILFALAGIVWFVLPSNLDVAFDRCARAVGRGCRDEALQGVTAVLTYGQSQGEGM